MKTYTREELDVAREAIKKADERIRLIGRQPLMAVDTELIAQYVTDAIKEVEASCAKKLDMMRKADSDGNNWKPNRSNEPKFIYNNGYNNGLADGAAAIRGFKS